MNEVELLGAIGDRDAEVDRASRAIEQAKRALDAARVAVTAAIAARAASEQARVEHAKHTHALERRIDEYRVRERGALRALETGAGDATAAERQLAQCRAILDETETEQIVAMDRDDALRATLATQAAAITDAEAAERDLTARTPGVISKAEAAITAADAHRREQLAALTDDTRKRYESLRTSKRRNAVVRIVDGTCSACQMTVPMQQLADLRAGRLSACRGCTRFIVP
jgi:predicted  nucleic acid-binding Zn-ribbon protein